VAEVDPAVPSHAIRCPPGTQRATFEVRVVAVAVRTLLAVSMNFGPLVLTNIGPPSGD